MKNLVKNEANIIDKYNEISVNNNKIFILTHHMSLTSSLLKIQHSLKPSLISIISLKI